MNKVVLTFIVLAFLIPAIFYLSDFIPKLYTLYFPFKENVHVLLEAITALFAFLVFLKANYIYSKTKDGKIAIIAAGFLAGCILQVYHLLVSRVFPYDVLTANYVLNNPHLLYVLIGRWIFSVTLFSSLFFNIYTGGTIPENFKRNVYIIFLGFLFVIIFLNNILTPLILYLFQNNTDKLVVFSNSLEAANNSIYLLTAFIYLDIKFIRKEKLISCFILGLLLLGTGQLFFLVPYTLVGAYGIFSHIARLIGFLLILIGLKDIYAKPFSFSFRHKLFSYLSLFLIISYLIFVSFSSVIFDIKFPPFASYFFLEFFIIAIMIQYKLSSGIVAPIEKINSRIEKHVPGQMPEKIPVISKDEIGLLAERLNDITEANWGYTQELLSRQKEEKIKLSIINSIRSALTSEEMLRNIVNTMGTTLRVESCIMYNFDSKTSNFYPVPFEFKTNFDIPSLIGSDLSRQEALEEIYQNILNNRDIFIVNDIEESSLKDVTKKYFRDYKIIGFLFLPLIFKNEILSILAFYSFKSPYNWTDKIIDLIKSIEPQISLSVYQSQLFTATEKTSQREQILREIIVSALGSTNIEDVLKTIVTKTGKLFNADRCYFVEYNAKKDEYLPIKRHSVYLSGLDIKNVTDKQFSREEILPFTKFTAEQNQILVVNDINEIDIPQKTKKLISELNIKSFMMAPMIYAYNPIGALIVDSVHEYRKFIQDEIELLEAISNQGAIITYQAQLYGQVEEKGSREELLRRITTNILASENLEKALSSISKEIALLFDADKVNIRFYNESEKNFTEAMGEYRRSIDTLSDLGKGEYSKDLSDYIFKRNFIDKNFIMACKLAACKNIEIESDKKLLDELNAYSVTIAPVLYKSKPLAIIVITNTQSAQALKKEKRDLLAPISQQISIGINLFKLNDELKIALNNEKTLRKISTEATALNNHAEIDDYLLDQLLKVFKLEKILHFHIKEEKLIIVNKKKKNDDGRILKSGCLLIKDISGELIPEPDELICINDINKEITNEVLKECLIEENIIACAVYPISKRVLLSESKEAREVIELTMLAYSAPKYWTAQEKSLIKLIIDTISLVSLEVMQKQELEETRNTFIATLTHDLRSPIIAEQKALEFMILKKPESLPEAYVEYLEDIYNTNKDLLKIVNNLLAVYHYESGHLELDKTESSIPELIDGPVRSLKYIAEDKESDISIDLAKDLPLVNVDKDEIQRVLSNLIGNALKHTKKGTKILIGAYKVDNGIQVSVKDNGQGIPQENIPMIFQRYPTEKRKIGTGLGLYLSKQIIEAHKGKIWFETEEGKGTTFYFTLPV